MINTDIVLVKEALALIEELRAMGYCSKKGYNIELPFSGSLVRRRIKRVTPQARYKTVAGFVSGKSISTQAQIPKVRTVSTRSTKGNVTLRYTPLDQGSETITSY